MSYFNSRPSNEWSYNVALNDYINTYGTKENALVEMKNDLQAIINNIHNRAATIKKAKTLMTALEKAPSEGSSKPQNVPSNPPNTSQIQNQSIKMKGKNTVNNILQPINENNRQGNKRRSEEIVAPATVSMNTKRRIAKMNQHSESDEYDQEDMAIHEQGKLTLTINTKKFTVPAPSRGSSDHHKPKITKVNFQALQNYVHMASESFNSSVESINSEYEHHSQQQEKNSSLKSLPGVFDYLLDVLKLKHEYFPVDLWGKSVSHITDQKSLDFVKIINYSLTCFHCNTLTNCTDVFSHERTSFVNYVIPCFQALSKVTGLLDFYWCEKELSSTRMFYLKEADYDQRKISVKNIDGLGLSPSHGLNSEQVIIESSSGLEKEHVPHTLEDTAKLIESSTIGLSTEARHYKNASINTFKNLKAFSVHIIKNHITLTATSLHDKKTWKNIELRTSVIPTNWSDRLHWVKLMEMIATLMDELYTMKQVQEDLLNEHLGVTEINGEAVHRFLNA